MTKIAKVVANSRLGEVNATASNILTAYAKSSIADDVILLDFISQLTETNTSLTTAIDRDKALSELDKYDDIRDKVLQNINLYLRGMVCVPDVSIKAAATQLSNIFQKYGIGITWLSYNEESAKINSLLGDLATSESQENIAKLLLLDQIVQALKDAQKQFSTVYYNYVEQLRKADEKQSASECKQEVLGVINNKVITYLRGMLTFNSKVYGTLAKDIDIIIDRNNEQVRKRKNSISNESD